MTASVWLRVALLSLLWGCSYLLMKLSVAALPPLTVVLLRTLIAAAVLAALLPLLRQRLPLRREVLLACLGMGILNNLVPFTMIIWSQKTIGIGLGSVLNASTPFLTAIAAHLLTQDERLTATRLAGTAIGVAGVAVLMAPTLGIPGSDGVLLAAGAAMLAALSQALAAIFGRRLRGLRVRPVAAATGQITAAALLSLPLALLIDRPWTLPPPSPAIWLVILALGVFCTALAFILYFSILASAGANAAPLAMMLVPVNTTLIGGLLLGERLLPVQWLGTAMVLLGLVVISGRLRLPQLPR